MKPMILVMDDEKGILDFMSVLFSTDFEVLTALSADEALDQLRKNPQVVAIISDKDRRKAGGRTGELEEVGIRLLGTVRELYPHIKRIMMSGRTPSPPLDPDLVAAFWAKPFEPFPALKELKSILEQTAVVA